MHGVELHVNAFGNGERDDAPLDALEIDDDSPARRPLAVLALRRSHPPDL
jgi:hypothetical protein